jgi:hypothetical protein
LEKKKNLINSQAFYQNTGTPITITILEKREETRGIEPAARSREMGEEMVAA